MAARNLFINDECGYNKSDDRQESFPTINRDGYSVGDRARSSAYARAIDQARAMSEVTGARSTASSAMRSTRPTRRRKKRPAKGRKGNGKGTGENGAPAPSSSAAGGRAPAQALGKE